MSGKQRAAVKPKEISREEVRQSYNQMQSEMQAIAQKIGELESEAEEHGMVIRTLDGILPKDSKRRCFRLIGGVLVEQTVEDVAPNLKTNLEGIKKVVESLVQQYKTKETEFVNFKRDYNISVQRV